MKKKHPMVACLLAMAVAVLSANAVCSGHQSESRLAVQAGVNALKKALNANDPKAVADCLRFPLYRQYPIPAVQSANEFIARYSEIFDDYLIAKIMNSDFERDWAGAGWRGYMLSDGLVWVELDGKVYGINHQSAKEVDIRAKLIAEDKSCTHPSIQNFKHPVLKWDTKHYHIRIDDLGGTFRYASWKIGRNITEIPDLIITGGTVEYQGSGGNHEYIFKNGSYEYQCYVSVIYERGQIGIGFLTVKKGGQAILSDEAQRRY